MKKPLTDAQIRRQRHRDHGKYAQVNPCYGCGKSAGEDYFSHPLSDQNGSDGKPWDDVALCLCLNCYNATKNMTRVDEFIAFSKAHGGNPAPPPP